MSLRNGQQRAEDPEPDSSNQTPTPQPPREPLNLERTPHRDPRPSTTPLDSFSSYPKSQLRSSGNCLATPSGNLSKWRIEQTPNRAAISTPQTASPEPHRLPAAHPRQPTADPRVMTAPPAFLRRQPLTPTKPPAPRPKFSSRSSFPSTPARTPLQPSTPSSAQATLSRFFAVKTPKTPTTNSPTASFILPGALSMPTANGTSDGGAPSSPPPPPPDARPQESLPQQQPAHIDTPHQIIGEPLKPATNAILPAASSPAAKSPAFSPPPPLVSPPVPPPPLASPHAPLANDCESDGEAPLPDPFEFQDPEAVDLLSSGTPTVPVEEPKTVLLKRKRSADGIPRDQTNLDGAQAVLEETPTRKLRTTSPRPDPMESVAPRPDRMELHQSSRTVSPQVVAPPPDNPPPKDDSPAPGTQRSIAEVNTEQNAPNPDISGTSTSSYRTVIDLYDDDIEESEGNVSAASPGADRQSSISIGYKTSCERCHVSFPVNDSLDNTICPKCAAIVVVELDMTPEPMVEGSEEEAPTVEDSNMEDSNMDATNADPEAESQLESALQDMAIESSASPKREESEIWEFTEETKEPASPAPPAPIRPPGVCVHNNPNCDEIQCVDDFFVPSDPFEDTLEIREIRRENRCFGGVIRAADPLPVGEVYDDIPDDDKGILLAAGDTAFQRPYLPECVEDRDCAAEVRRKRNRGSNEPAPPLDRVTFIADYLKRRLGNDWKNPKKHPFMHVDFTYPEMWRVIKFIGGDMNLEFENTAEQVAYVARLRARDEIVYSDEDITTIVPGRTQEEVERFVEDCLEGCVPAKGQWVANIPINNPRNNMSIRLANELGGKRFRVTESTWDIRTRKAILSQAPYRVFSEGSSDVMDISWSPNGQRFGFGCVVYNDEYNRAGNLMVGDIHNMSIKMLDGHSIPRPNANAHPTLDPRLYTSVTAISYSPDGALFYSGSFDKTVRVWMGEDAAHLNTFHLPGQVENLAVSRHYPRTLAIGSKDGSVTAIPMDSDGNESGERHTFAQPKKSLAPNAIRWGNCERPNWLFVGYGQSDDAKKNGDLQIYDLVAQRVATKISPAAVRTFDLCVHPEGAMLAAGVPATNSSSRSAPGTKSHVRLYDILASDRSVRSQIEFDSYQKDINSVTMSPCQTYITSSGTDGTTVVWDHRFADRILHTLSHGPTLMPILPTTNIEEEDTGVTFASWGPTTSLFFTGSSDGVVKVWDILTGAPFIKDLCRVSTQIMTARFNPGFDMLLVGETSGKATLLSTRADAGSEMEGFHVEYPEGWRSPETEGRDMAREWVKQGKMVVKGESAWAAGKGRWW